MKNRSYLLLAVVIVVLVVAAISLTWLNKPGEKPITATNPAGTLEARVAEKLTVITLYQKGEGESDLAAFVASELAAKNSGLAKFKVINTLDDPQIMDFYGVTSVPAIVFLSPSGKVARKHEGYLDKALIVNILKSMK